MPQAGKKAPTSEAEISLVVNGELYEVRVQSSWTLQYLLHTELGLTGNKEFCSEGACGACAVILDGRSVLSCMTLAIVRLLYARFCGYCEGFAGQEPQPDGRGNKGSPCRQPVPVRHVSPAHQSNTGSSQ
jgi:hypothetical protein